MVLSVKHFGPRTKSHARNWYHGHGTVSRKVLLCSANVRSILHNTKNKTGAAKSPGIQITL